MPKSMKVRWFISNERVWTHFELVSKAPSDKFFFFFHIYTVSHAEIIGHKFLYDILNKRNSFGVIDSTTASMLSGSLQNFNLVPVAKQSPVPHELTPYADACKWCLNTLSISKRYNLCFFFLFLFYEIPKTVTPYWASWCSKWRHGRQNQFQCCQKTSTIWGT